MAVAEIEVLEYRRILPTMPAKYVFV